MFNKPIAYTVVLLYSLLIEIDAHYSNNFLHSRLVNPKFSTDLRDGNVENEVYTRYEAVKLIIPKFKRSRYQFESTSGNSSTVQPTDGSNPQTRFIDFDEDEEDAPQGSDDTKKREPHATTTESSFIDLLIGSDDDDTKKNSEENETDEDNEIDDYEDEDEDEDEDKDGKKGDFVICLLNFVMQNKSAIFLSSSVCIIIVTRPDCLEKTVPIFP